jgi:hypothetical protein
MTNKNVKYPCQNCKYFNACGKTSRTEPCEGREVANKRSKRKIRRQR